MYISDVLKLADKYCPSEYDAEEMYIWCDEVSSMLAIEDRYVLREKLLFPASDGTVLLPEGVDVEDIRAVYSPKGEIKKLDFETLSFRRLRTPEQGAVLVVYVMPYIPIRRVRYRGAVTVNGGEGSFELPCPDILPGDAVTITFLASDGTARLELKGVMVMERDFYENGFRFTACSPDGSFESAGEISGEDALVRREVTDMTLCDAPFDSMYVDYILAKISLYQRDTEAYNRYMTAFNSRLSAYRRRLADMMPDGNGRLINWW